MCQNNRVLEVHYLDYSSAQMDKVLQFHQLSLEWMSLLSHYSSILHYRHLKVMQDQEYYRTGQQDSAGVCKILLDSKILARTFLLVQFLLAGLIHFQRYKTSQHHINQ